MEVTHLKLALPLLIGLVLALPAAAQKKRPNDPAECPYCHNDPALLRAAGLVSHGVFVFGKSDTAKVDELLPECDVRWIETANFRIGFALGTWKVKLEEKKKVLAELTRLHGCCRT
jgi:glutaredoxin